MISSKGWGHSRMNVSRSIITVNQFHCVVWKNWLALSWHVDVHCYFFGIFDIISVKCRKNLNAFNIGSTSLCCCHCVPNSSHWSVHFPDALLWDLSPCNLQYHCQVFLTLIINFWLLTFNSAVLVMYLLIVLRQNPICGYYRQISASFCVSF